MSQFAAVSLFRMNLPIKISVKDIDIATCILSRVPLTEMGTLQRQH